jgi:hypothetical protein
LVNGQNFTLWYYTDKFNFKGLFYEKSLEEKNEFNFSNSLIAALRVVSNKETEAGNAWSTRVIVIGYFFFGLIILSAYTANLTAILSANKATQPISTLDDIRSQPYSLQNGSEYGLIGVLLGTNSYTFWTTSSLTADLLPRLVPYSSQQDAVNDLLAPNSKLIAFSYAKPYLDALAAQNCLLEVQGNLLGTTNFGMRFSKNYDQKVISDMNIAIQKSKGIMTLIIER